MSADPKDFGPLFRHANPQPRAERPPFVSGARWSRYQVTFEARSEQDGIRALRWLLKRALRTFALKCIDVRELP